jgi:hypothetical protein
LHPACRGYGAERDPYDRRGQYNEQDLSPPAFIVSIDEHSFED